MSRARYEQGLSALLEAAGAAVQPKCLRGRQQTHGFKGGEMGPLLKATMVWCKPHVRRRVAIDRMTGHGEEAVVVNGGYPGDPVDVDAAAESLADFFSQPQASESELEALGLSPVRNSVKRPRYGLNGLTAEGKRRVEEGCRLLEKDRRLCALVTTTLPPEALWALYRGQGSTGALTTALLREFRLLLRARKLPEEIVGVIEIQEGRFGRSGGWAPHWHLVMRTRRHSRGKWVINLKDIDTLWRKVVLRVTGVDIGQGRADGKHNACNTEEIRKTVAGYLRKYMRKGSSEAVLAAIPNLPPSLVPHQWWCMSSSLLSVIQSLTGRLHPALLLYINRVEKQLIEDGLLFSKWRGKLDSVPPMVTYYFPSLDALAAVVARWEASRPTTLLEWLAVGGLPTF